MKGLLSDLAWSLVFFAFASLAAFLLIPALDCGGSDEPTGVEWTR